MDNTIIIPTHISKNALYTAQFFIFDSFVAFLLGYKTTSFLLFCLYFTTILHWSRVRQMSVIKIIDMVVALSTILHAFLVDSHRFDDYFVSGIIIPTYLYSSLAMFVYNEVVFYYQVFYERPIPDNYFIKMLQYTLPNSKEREFAYYRSTYTHMLFFHVSTTCFWTICAVLSR
jgi:hypothetical protein